jgi:hypothetical protein
LLFGVKSSVSPAANGADTVSETMKGEAVCSVVKGGIGFWFSAPAASPPGSGFTTDGGSGAAPGLSSVTGYDPANEDISFDWSFGRLSTLDL